PIGFGLEAHHLAARARGGLAVDPVQIRRLPTQTRAVINDIGRHLHRGVVEKPHGRLKCNPAPIAGEPPPAAAVAPARKQRAANVAGFAPATFGGGGRGGGAGPPPPNDTPTPK